MYHNGCCLATGVNVGTAILAFQPVFSVRNTRICGILLSCDFPIARNAC